MLISTVESGDQMSQSMLKTLTKNNDGNSMPSNSPQDAKGIEQ